jgi:hypothetical protein
VASRISSSLVRDSLLARFRKLTKMGFPARFPVVQFPNAPLALAVIAGVLAGALRGEAHRYLMAIAYLSLTVWGYEELSRGVNWFRRLLGIVFLLVTVVRVARGLGS